MGERRGEQTAAHELRAQVDAVAVGGGDREDGVGPGSTRGGRHTARTAAAPVRPPSGPAPAGPDLERRSGALEDELRALAGEGVQSLLLEGGPTLASAFLEADLVDKLLVFCRRRSAGEGLRLLLRSRSSRTLSQLSARRVGADVLLEAYVHQP